MFCVYLCSFTVWFMEIVFFSFLIFRSYNQLWFWHKYGTAYVWVCECVSDANVVIFCKYVILSLQYFWFFGSKQQPNSVYDWDLMRLNYKKVLFVCKVFKSRLHFKFEGIAQNWFLAHKGVSTCIEYMCAFLWHHTVHVLHVRFGVRISSLGAETNIVHFDQTEIFRYHNLLPQAPENWHDQVNVMFESYVDYFGKKSEWYNACSNGVMCHF